jgi:hypothetical protein
MSFPWKGYAFGLMWKKSINNQSPCFLHTDRQELLVVGNKGEFFLSTIADRQNTRPALRHTRQEGYWYLLSNMIKRTEIPALSFFFYARGFRDSTRGELYFWCTGHGILLSMTSTTQYSESKTLGESLETRIQLSSSSTVPKIWDNGTQIGSFPKLFSDAHSAQILRIWEKVSDLGIFYSDSGYSSGTETSLSNSGQKMYFLPRSG